jgi:hemolysin III
MTDLATAAHPAQLYDVDRGLHYAKPRLRGWLHLASFEAALVLGTLLIVTAQGPRQITVASIYAGTVCGMFGASALYHRGNWSVRANAALQRLDHLMIFMVIAGSATAPMALAVPAPYSWIGLTILWSLTLAAAALRMVKMATPEWVGGAIFVGLGWVAGAAIPEVWIHAGVAPAVLFLAGGVLYTLGALGYHRRWPNPRPAVFGYHEVFHSYVTLAAACHYVAIAVFLL